MNSREGHAARPLEGSPTYEFEGFRLDAQHRVLYRATGEPIPLPPKAVETLLHLVRRPGELLTRQALLDSIWPGLVVEENNLSQAISLLRRVLGEKPSEHRFIVTEPGRGYRFVAAVRILEQGRPGTGEAAGPPSAPLSSAADRRGLFAPLRVALIGAAAAASLLVAGVIWRTGGDSGADRLPSSVAVLPFEDLSPAPEHGYFAAGIHAELVGRLAKVSGLNVIAATSMRRYAGTGLSIREIADELGVETVMEGSVHYADDRVRVTVNLIDAATRASRWSEVYDRRLEDVFGIQADIAASIAAALETEFSAEDRRLLARPRTDSPEAYALYLQAREMLPDLGRRDELLARAIEFDPRFADAYALRAQNFAHSIVDSYSQYASRDAGGLDTMAEALAAKALELDPANTLAYGALAVIHRQHWRWTEAIEVYERGREVDPTFIEGSWLYAFMGDHDKAIELTRRGLRLNPYDPVAHIDLALTLLWARRTDEAIASFRRAIELRPGNPVAHLLLARAYIQRGDRAEALQQLKVSEQLFGERFMEMPVAVEVAYYYSRVGEQQEAARLVAALEQGALRHKDDGVWAMAHLALGERAKALEVLERVIDRAGRRELEPAFLSLMMLRLNETADPVLELPEFADARRRMAGV